MIVVRKIELLWALLRWSPAGAGCYSICSVHVYIFFTVHSLHAKYVVTRSLVFEHTYVYIILFDNTEIDVHVIGHGLFPVYWSARS